MHHPLRIHTNGYKLRSTVNSQKINITFTYIDIEKPIENEKHHDIANRITEDEFFYPLVMINDEMIGEGYIQLKPVYAALEKYGYTTEI